MTGFHEWPRRNNENQTKERPTHNRSQYASPDEDEEVINELFDQIFDNDDEKIISYLIY